MSAALGDRRDFPALESFAYLAHSAVAPPSVAVRGAMLAFIDDYARRGIGAIGPWIAQREELRGRLASLVGSEARDVGFVPNTTAGINLVAQGLRWRAGERVAVLRGEFPTNVLPWQQAARRHDLGLVWLELEDFAAPGGRGLVRLEDELRRGLRLVAVSAVQFHTGLRMPVAEIAALCRRHGARLCVDGIQAVGVCPFDMGVGVDFLACGGHKWLGGVEGAGFVAISPDGLAALDFPSAGWLSLERPIDFLLGPGALDYGRPIRREASAAEAGVLSGVGYAALHAAVAPLCALGVSAIFAHVQAYIDALEPALVARGFRSMRDPRPERRSGIASFALPEALTGRMSALELAEALDARGVRVTTPDGLLRFAPHWSNQLHEIPRVLGALDEALATRGEDRGPGSAG